MKDEGARRDKRVAVQQLVAVAGRVDARKVADGDGCEGCDRE